MKVLVTYLSQSGNTEKIAKAIYDEVSLANKAALKKLIWKNCRTRFKVMPQ